MKFTVFGLSGFTLYLRVISNYKAPGGLYLTEGFLRYEFGGGGGGIFGGAYTWRGLFSEFYGNLNESTWADHYVSL